MTMTLLHHPDMLGIVVRREVDGGLLEMRRRDLGWTQAELAQRARVSHRTVQNAEAGHVGDRTYAAIVRALESGEQDKGRDQEPDMATVTYVVEAADGPIRVVVTARRDVVGRLDFTALVAHALDADQH